MNVRPPIASVSHNPSGKDPSIAVPGAQHCEPLHLVDHFRKLSRTAHLADKEREKIRELLADRAAQGFGANASAGVETPEQFIERQERPLAEDLRDFWTALGARAAADRVAAEQDFWRFAFSRRLAAELAGMRAIGPLAQLVRINAEVAGRLRMIHHAGKLEQLSHVPRSEMQPFWRERIEEELKRRQELGFNPSGRSETAIKNDAGTIAIVQALANAAARRGDRKRYVLVTADSLLVDVYRNWHCHSALGYEAFIIRPVRHFAPLLNAANLVGAREPADHEAAERRDIFPALQAAIDPFLLSLNLSPRQATERRSLGGSGHSDDAVRWPRELFSLRLQRLIDDHRARLKRGEPDSENLLLGGVADQRLFAGSHFDKLAFADESLVDVSTRGRQIERSAIGLGFHPLCTRLEALQVATKLLDRFADHDDAALAAYIQEMVDDLGSANLDVRVRSLDIARDLRDVVTSESFLGLGERRVPLALNIEFLEGGSAKSIAAEAETMIHAAIAQAGPVSHRAEHQQTFDRDLQASNLGHDGGYRLYALYACIALRFGNWALAHHYADEALRRAVRFFPQATSDVVELEYLLALCIRFRFGDGVVRDATASDISFDRYSRARALLLAQLSRSSELSGFALFRAASELTALVIFGSIWSIAAKLEPPAPYPQLPEDLFREELPLAHSLSKQLSATQTDGSLVSTNAVTEEVFEQAHSNTAAIYCLSALLARAGEAPIRSIEEDDQLRSWLEASDPHSSRVNEPLPPITGFYDYWYRRVGADGSVGRSEIHFALDLKIDTVVSDLFMHVLG